MALWQRSPDHARGRSAVPFCVSYLWMMSTAFRINRKRPPTKVSGLLVVEVTRLELAASASRTQRSTKLSHTSMLLPSILYSFPPKKPHLDGCPTRIRTQTNRVRVCRATFTQSGNMHKSRLILYRTSRKSQVLCRYFWKNVGAWRGTDWERYDGRAFSKNTVPWGKCPQKT